jgi:hypothetical protein
MVPGTALFINKAVSEALVAEDASLTQFNTSTGAFLWDDSPRLLRNPFGVGSKHPS